MTEVWDFSTARRAAHNASAAQKEAEEFFAEANEACAIAESAYRQELAKETLRLRVEGMPATVIPDLAKGNERIAALRQERDIALGIRDAAKHRLFRHGADRRDVHHFLTYSLAVNTGRAMD